MAVHSPIAIEIQLPEWMHERIHPVFHPMYLKLSDTVSTQKNLRWELGDVFREADYGVDRILAHRVNGKKTEYLVQWEGCSYLQSTYEPEEALAHAQRKLAQYQAKRRKIEMDVACVLCEDPLRTGAIFASTHRLLRDASRT